MTRSLRLSSAAQRDIAATKEWYAEQPVPNLDIRFQEELEHVFQQIERFPASFPLVYKSIRRANLHRFPYSAFYHMESGRPFVLAVVHHARHPDTWKHRR